MYDAKKLANRLLISRRDLQLDQKTLGKLSGVSNTYISDIERWRITNVGVEVVFSLADALGVSPGYLIGLTEDPYGGIKDSELQPEERQQLDALVQEFLTVFQQLSDDKKQTLLNLARMLRSADEPLQPRIIGGAS
jgi:transcriptional regulator with XRE-family HTH domain